MLSLLSLRSSPGDHAAPLNLSPPFFFLFSARRRVGWDLRFSTGPLWLTASEKNFEGGRAGRGERWGELQECGALEKKVERVVRDDFPRALGSRGQFE